LRGALNSLMIKCTLGCSAIISLEHLAAHQEGECQMRPVRCMNKKCTYNGPVKDLDSHYKECLHALVECGVCGVAVSKMDMPAHQAVKKCYEKQLKRQRVTSAKRLSSDLKIHRDVLLHQRHLSDQQERQLIRDHYDNQHRESSSRPTSAVGTSSIQSRIGNPLVVLPQYSRSLSLSNATSCGPCENKFLSGRRPSARRHSHAKPCDHCQHWRRWSGPRGWPSTM
jgi:hypothetical protein